MHTSHNDRTVRQGMPAVLPGIGRATRCALLAALAGLALLAAGCSTRPPLQTANPQMQAARQACRDVPDAGRYTCIEQQAIAALDPDVCRLLGIAIDDMCLQAVYEAADDPAICDRLYLPGIVPTCKAYYADPDHVPLLLTPTPLAADARLGWLAYMLDGDIWIKDLLDGQPQRITDDGVNEAPRWSPSGRWLAFRKLESQLWLYSLETQQAWAVDQGAPVYQFDWSPVADRLAYSVGSGIMHLSLLTAFPDGSTETTVLVPPQVAHAALGLFAWSPDGDRLVVDWSTTGDGVALQAELRVIPLDGGDAVTVATRDMMTEGSITLGGWAPQGERILYAPGLRPIDSFMPDKAPLLSVAADGSEFAAEPRQVSQTASVLYLDELAPAPAGSGRWEQDATAVVASYGPSPANQRIEVLGAPWTPPDQMAIQPAWSPDGKVLAYSGMPAEGEPTVEELINALDQRRIWLLPGLAGDEAPRALTSDPEYRDEWPQWSADGQHILFARMDVAGAASLWLVDAQGGRPRQVVEKITLGSDEDRASSRIEWERSVDWLRWPAIPSLEPPASVLTNSAAAAVSVPFTVCQSSETWVRPTEEEQAREIWSKGRYDDVPQSRLRWQFHHTDFGGWGGGNSEIQDRWRLSGLWNAQDFDLYEACGGMDGRQRAIIEGRAAEIWAFHHRVERVQWAGDVYTVTVTPASTGYQMIQAPRLSSNPYDVHFVDSQGHVIEPLVPPWKEVPVSTAEVAFTGKVVASAQGGQAISVSSDEDGILWQVPRLEGTMIERSDGSPAGFDDLTSGTQVEIVGFRQLPPEPPNTISAVSIAIDDQENVKSSLIPYSSEELGLALAFPSGWRIEESPQGIGFRGPSHGSGPTPLEARLSILVKPAAAGTSLDDVVAAQLAQYPDLASQIDRTDITLGGETAAVLEVMPGQFSNRQAFVLHGGRLYQILVMPYDTTPWDNAVFDEMQAEGEAIWQAVVDSWQFLD